MSEKIFRPGTLTTFIVHFVDPKVASLRYTAEACLPLGSDYVFVDSRGTEIGRVPTLKVASVTTE